MAEKVKLILLLLIHLFPIWIPKIVKEKRKNSVKSKDKYAGSHSYHFHLTPKWQEPITSFFGKNGGLKKSAALRKPSAALGKAPDSEVEVLDSKVEVPDSEMEFSAMDVGSICYLNNQVNDESTPGGDSNKADPKVNEDKEVDPAVNKDDEATPKIDKDKEVDPAVNKDDEDDPKDEEY